MSEEEFGILDVQSAFLRSVSTTRNEVAKIFAEIEQLDRSLSTLNQLFYFIDARSEALFFLISNGHLWDAEIVLRSFYEANAKVLYVCYRNQESRKVIIDEFWGDFAEMHNQKKMSRSTKALEMTTRFGSEADSRVFAFLGRDDIFKMSPKNKAYRRDLEGKWSFSEIIKYLETDAKELAPLKGVAALSHMYGMQSHLCHADDVALDLMRDHATRQPEERRLKELSHICRMFSDVSSFWLFSLEALQFCVGQPFDRKSEVWDLWHELSVKSKPIKEAFEKSQNAFYDIWSGQVETP